MTDILKETCDALAGGMVKAIDDLLLAELSRHCGKPVTADEIPGLAGRLLRKVYPDKIEIWEFDNVPFLELHPMTTRMDGFKLIAEQKFRSIK